MISSGADSLFTHTNTCVHSYCKRIASGVKKNEWQRVGNGAISLNPRLCFLLPSPSRRRNSLSASHISHYGINHPLLHNIIMNEINGVFVSVCTLKYLGGDCERATRSLVFPLGVHVFNFVPHAMKKWLWWCVLRGSVVCQAQWLQPLSNLFQHASV